MKTSIDRLHVGAGTTIGPLTLFPVWSESTPAATFTLPNDENFKVGELPSATVPFLSVENCGTIDLLIPEGTILEGGLQTRIAANDYVIAAGAKMDISVRCVERGRWGGGVREHKTDGRAPSHVLASLRKSLKSDGFAPESQAEVWESVSRIERHFGHKPSGSLNDIFADEGMSSRKERAMRHQQRREAEDRIVNEAILDQLEKFASQPVSGQQGVIIGIAGEPISLELYATPEAFAAQYVALVRAACLDAVFAEWKPTLGAKARKFAERVAETKLESIQRDAKSESGRGLSEDVDLRAIFAAELSDSALRASAINRKHLVNA